MRLAGVDIALRPYRSSDAAFVHSTFRHQIWDHLRKVKKDDWAVVGKDVTAALLKACDVTVACNALDDNVLVGWRAVLDGEELWAYVLREFRGFGIGHLLRNHEASKG